jgi:hypothetical protein
MAGAAANTPMSLPSVGITNVAHTTGREAPAEAEAPALLHFHGVRFLAVDALIEAYFLGRPSHLHRGDLLNDPQHP